MKNIIALTIIQMFSHQAVAEITGLFGIELGKPFPKYSATTSESTLPFTFFRVPIPKDYEVNSFHDYEVRLSKTTNNVFYIEAERAYLTTEECMRDLMLLKNHLIKLFGKPTSHSEWSSISGNREARVTCSRINNSPYNTLYVVAFDRNEQ